jgi:hypothetical protein
MPQGTDQKKLGDHGIMGRFPQDFDENCSDVSFFENE